MFSQLSQLRESFSMIDCQQELSFKTLIEECAKDFEDTSVCCSTPRNKLFTAAIMKTSQTSIVTSLDEDSNDSKIEDQKSTNSSIKDIDTSKEKHEDSKQSSEENKQSNLLQDSLIEDMLLSHQKSRDLSMRQDVINKHSLRSIKKFYTNIFKQKNIRIVRTRFCNVSNGEIVKAAKKTFRQEFRSESLPKDFFHYLAGILKFKDSCNINCSSKLINDINDFHDCCCNYTKRKFNALFKSQFFKILCRKFVSKNELDVKFRFLIKQIE